MSHRMVVTGQGGFVGSALTQRASLNPAIQIVPFVDPITGQKVDIRNTAAVDRAICAIKPDSIIHLAAVAAPQEARSDPDRVWDVNFNGTRHIANAIMKNVPNARMIFSGSSEIYGVAFNDYAGQPVPESALTRPATVYGATKGAAELCLRQMAVDGLDVICFRPFNHTGPGQSAAYVVSAFAKQVAAIKLGLQPPIMTTGNLDAVRDFLDVRDVVDAYLDAAIRQELGKGDVFNLATGTPVSIRSILNIVLALADVSVDIQIDPVRNAALNVPMASGDPTKAKQELGWKRHYELHQTINDVLNFWLSEMNDMRVCQGNER